jgi:DNA-binding NarL/FixJ family response regulator
LKILVCDDHAVFRDGLRLVLEGLAEAVELLEASDGAQALDVAKANPDLELVLMDLQMPGVGGIEGLRRMRSENAALPVVIVSASEASGEMRRVLDEGAAGFIPKSFGREELLAALRLVLSGGVFVPRAALAAEADAGPAGGGKKRRRERAARLTNRQLEVLSLMARGLTNREICGVLSISENTVKAHVKAILEALEATNRTEAAVLARELDLKAPGEE